MARTVRIYQACPLKVGQAVSLDKKSSHHVAHVLRFAVGDPLTIFNGDGCDYDGKVESISRQAVTVIIEQKRAESKESPLNLRLAMGIIKADAMDFVIQKAVELGVREITPILAARSQLKWRQSVIDKRVAHWQAVMEQACEQCGRNCLPVLKPPCLFDDFLNDVSGEVVVLDPVADSTWPTVNVSADGITLLIGPEGGWTDDECAAFDAHAVTRVCLGPRVLRAETAAVVGLSLAQHHFGDLK
jgi:16S rRNA (uracil1498-N3)-methyltransferase